jgi:alginate O-acetyltransferase complex protein AlgI
VLFNSLTFLIFFAVVLAVYYGLRAWPARKAWLLAASYAFYGAWSPPFALLLAASSVFDWWLGHRIDAAEGRRRRFWLVASLASNLGLLGYFKYGDFLLDNFVAFAATLGVHYAPPDWDIVLPVGISFYTFQSLSYTIDVYRRQLRPHWTLTDFMLYVSFFPQLVAGPIVRAADFLPQLLAPKSATRDQFGWGLCLLVFGLFCKVVLADSVFAPAVDPVYGATGTLATLDAWTAVLAFSGQIYYDFCGYSICAVGAALCLGFRLPDNFDRPYAAAGITDFWRRWHLSLSTWLRDYLYIPLGGSRHGRARTALALMLTMLLGGLWHGASWLFVLWGGLHGALLVLERVARGWRGAPAREAQARGGLRLVLALGATFLLVTLIWIPFRAGSPAQAWNVLQALWPQAGAVPQLDPLTSFAAFAAIAATLGWQWSQRATPFSTWFSRLRSDTQAALVAAAAFACYLASGDAQHAFIYFQF